MNDFFPLLSDIPDSQVIAFYEGRLIHRNEFLAHVEQVRHILPKKKYCINLCDDRYLFLVVFSACVSLEQISLLPNSRAEKEILRLQETYKDNCLIEDDFIAEICQKNINTLSGKESNFKINSSQDVSIVFTSGSTGAPKENLKKWGQLFESAKMIKERFSINEKQQHSFIATIPPQHMFGFETTIIFPLILGVAIHAGRPFYPLDIQSALLDMPTPRVLVTTPIHLKACNSDKKTWPEIDFVISATAEMPEKTALEGEKNLNANVFEIYGCSEAGAIATRQMTKDKKWHLLKEYSIRVESNSSILKIPSCEDNIIIPDKLNIHDECYFSLIGRDSDLIKMGGKRSSLNDLTNKLKSINGVSDAIFILPDESFGKRTRLAAIVVSSENDEYILRKQLEKYIDPVFLPRPIIFVNKLPYNEIGKLPREKLLEIIKPKFGTSNNKEIV